MENNRENLDASGSDQSSKKGVETAESRALSGAMELFWSRGAEVASYNELVTATGLSRKALYRLWPEKDALIADTLRAYRSQMLPQLTEPLRLGGRKGLEAFWQRLDDVAQIEGWKGCYLFRTASGPMRAQPFVGEIFYDYIDELGQSLVDCIIVGQRAGDIDESIQADLAATQLIALICLISAIGAQIGYGPRVKKLIEDACATSGVSAPAA